MAAQRWGRLGARTHAEARAFFVSSFRRRIGVAVVREMARHRLRRVAYIGVPRAVLDERRRAAAGRSQVAPELPPSDFYAYQAYLPAGRAM